MGADTQTLIFMQRLMEAACSRGAAPFGCTTDELSGLYCTSTQQVNTADDVAFRLTAWMQLNNPQPLLQVSSTSTILEPGYTEHNQCVCSKRDLCCAQAATNYHILGT